MLAALLCRVNHGFESFILNELATTQEILKKNPKADDLIFFFVIASMLCVLKALN